MWMELHGMTDDVRNLIVSAIIHSFHRMENTALNRLQTVLNVGNGTFENYVTCVIQEPVLVHSRKVMYGRSIKSVGWFIIRMGVLPLNLFLWGLSLHVFYFVIHNCLRSCLSLKCKPIRLQMYEKM